MLAQGQVRVRVRLGQVGLGWFWLGQVRQAQGRVRLGLGQVRVRLGQVLKGIFKDLKKICPEIFMLYFSTFICSRETSSQIHILYFQPSKISQIIYDTSYLIYHSIHILKLSPTEVHSLTHSSHMLFITIHSLFKNFILYFFILYLSCFILQQCYPLNEAF